MSKTTEILKSKCSEGNLKKLKALNSDVLMEFVATYIEHCEPDEVFVCADSKEDAASFGALNDLVIAQYGELEVAGVRLDGERTLAENVADLGGIQVAYDALESELTHGGATVATISSDFSPAQRFFISAASVWRSVIRDEALAAQLASDTHAPSVIRAVQPLRNCDAFHDAFDIGPGDPMYLPPADRIVIW